MCQNIICMDVKNLNKNKIYILLLKRNGFLNKFRNKTSINLVISQKKSIIFAVGIINR